MVRFAGLAVQALGAMGRVLRQSPLWLTILRTMREFKQNGTSWKSKFTRYAQVEIASPQNPQELRGALLGLGLSDADVDRYQDDIRATTADNVEQAIAREKKACSASGPTVITSRWTCWPLGSSRCCGPYPLGELTRLCRCYGKKQTIAHELGKYNKCELLAQLH